MEALPNLRRKSRTGGKKKQPPHNGDIVFTDKKGSIQTITSLTKRLKSVTETIIGLQYVWEYRSPSKSVPPHYQCKLCKVQNMQYDMAAHVQGWKHSFRYLKQNHKDKVPHDEEAAVRDPAVRKAVKTAAAEVEKAEGRGQIKVMLREPCEVVAFQGMRSAQPHMGFTGSAGIHGPSPRRSQQGGPFGGPFPDPMFRGEYPPRGELMSDFMGMHGDPVDGPMRRGQPDMGGFASPGRYGNGMSGPDMGIMEPEGMQHFLDDGSMYMGTDDFGTGQHSEGMGRPFPNDMHSSADKMMGNDPNVLEGNSIPATLLKYLDSFRIENEDDAQIVLKVTQKLTDVLMEYRLRSISTVPLPSIKSIPSSSLSSMNYSSSRLPHSSNDRFSSGMSGPSRFYN